MLRTLLAGVAAGQYQVVQTGDCSEDPAECTPEYLSRKVGVLDLVAGVTAAHSGLPVLRVGRFAGQFAKPRSRPVETVNGYELPVYRGELVNGSAPNEEERRPDPRRMLDCHAAALSAMNYLRQRSGAWKASVGAPVWTSHEALVLDYELPQIRPCVGERSLLTSTHWPWIGERTRRVDGAHVRMLANVVNPVACKVGPGIDVDQLVRLCEALDPSREPGRLTLIARMGADRVAEVLPTLVTAVRRAGHPAIWLCDPMHGNTTTAPSGYKTRLLSEMRREVHGFLEAVDVGGGVPGGLHLETTPDAAVTECVSDATGIAEVGRRYTSLCDPRLTPRQAVEIASVWRSSSGAPSTGPVPPASASVPTQ
ncbi:phenazine biosynthesis protein PhzC [Actinopolyspora lacussalsi]